MSRYDGLDRVRAGAMLLGVAYHATYAFMPEVGPWFPVQAKETWSGFSVLAGVLHAVRMPVFFTLSGFFSALVLEKRRERFLLDRANRLLVPFFVALPISLVSDVLIRRASKAQGTMHPALVGQDEWLFRPLHLWFLELLFLFCLVAWLVERTRLSFSIARLLRVPEVLLLGSLITAATVLHLGEPQPAFSFVPDVGSLLFFGPFFALGFLLFRSRESTQVLQRRGWWMAVAALAVCLFIYSRALQWQPLGHAMASLAAWLMSLGVVGPALRPGTREPGLLTQAAYWVYLVHHPLVQAGQVLVATWRWPAWSSYLVVVLSTLALGFVTFVLFVRGTFLGPWLGVRSQRLKGNMTGSPSAR